MKRRQRFAPLGDLLADANARTCDGIDDEPELIGAIQREDGRWFGVDACGFTPNDVLDLEASRRFDAIAAAFFTEVDG